MIKIYISSTLADPGINTFNGSWILYKDGDNSEEKINKGNSLLLCTCLEVTPVWFQMVRSTPPPPPPICEKAFSGDSASRSICGGGGEVHFFSQFLRKYLAATQLADEYVGGGG